MPKPGSLGKEPDLVRVDTSAVPARLPIPPASLGPRKMVPVAAWSSSRGAQPDVSR